MLGHAGAVALVRTGYPEATTTVLREVGNLGASHVAADDKCVAKLIATSRGCRAEGAICSRLEARP